MMVYLLSNDNFIIERFKSAFEGRETYISGSWEDLSILYSPAMDDVLLVDTHSIGTFDLKQLKTNVVVLVVKPQFAEAVIMVGHGIRGYGNRMMLPANMAHAAEAVRDGQVWMPPEIISRLIKSVKNPSDEQVDTSALTERELEVARLVAQGKTNAEIAEEADITVRTVKAHLTSIFSKTGLRDRVAVALQFK